MSDLKYIVTEEDELNCLTLADHIRRHFTLSSRMRGRTKREKLVLLNGQHVESYMIPMAGDEITIKLPRETSYFPPQDIPIDIIYEDDDLIAINKQAGVVVHPTYGMQDGTIANGLAKYMNDTGRHFKIRFINRLDMDTSGILLAAKNSYVQDGYSRQQQAENVHKEYITVVFGQVKDDSGIIDAPIGRPDPAAPFRGVTDDGKPSRSEYEVIKRYQANDHSTGGYSLVRVRLITGRTHQIRVHMAHIGHGVVGDEFYGFACPDLIARQALHAEKLSFVHPVTGSNIDLDAPLPDDIRHLIDIIK